jgi:hypothetical protein
MATNNNSKSTGVKREQENAAFRFLPFTVDLFARRGLRMKRAELIKVRRPEVLTLEVVEALEQVMSRGTLAFLCRAGGWRQLSRARAGVEEPERDARMIDPRVWKGLALEFGDPSIDAMIMTYNAICEAGGQHAPVEKRGKRDKHYPSSRKLSFRKNGDMLVHHIAWLKVREAPFKVSSHYWQFLTENPLTRLARLDVREVSAEDTVARLLQPDFEPLLPWLSTHLVRCWMRELETRWDSMERFDRLNQGMAAFFEALLQVSERDERRDLLRPLAEFFRVHLDAEGLEDQWEREFNRLARDLRFADRDAFRRTWGRSMEVGWQLWEQYTEARNIHPIDRESPDRVYMEVIEGVPYEGLAWRARAFANQLNAVIS